VRPGRHAATDGSFGRSAGGAAFRGAVLLAVAVVIGTILLQATDEQGDPFTQRTDDAAAVVTTTTAGEQGRDDEDPQQDGSGAVRPPAEVKVIALNASGVAGVARKASDALARAGYQVLPAGNADERTEGSAVFFTPGFEAEALELARGLGLPVGAAQALPTPPPAADLRGANLVVLIGPDLAQALEAPAATTTTAAPPG
jgi:hypothetical protein